MEKTKVLFISQEITPYLPENHMSNICRYLPQGIQESGKEIRTFMPRYGCINERRNQLHEVIRLSGMNLIINDTDHPLIIKVASIQAARMQVYFIDNEDYFQRKFTLCDDKNKYFNDNDERAIFFARGVIETVKKLRWSPDIVHCNGWFTGLVPMYLKRAFGDDPLFSGAKVVYSLYNDQFNSGFSNDFGNKTLVEGVSSNDVSELEESNYMGLSKLAIKHSDGVILGHPEINEELIDFAKQTDKEVLSYQSEEEYIQAYSNFYDRITAEVPVDTY